MGLRRLSSQMPVTKISKAMCPRSHHQACLGVCGDDRHAKSHVDGRREAVDSVDHLPIVVRSLSVNAGAHKQLSRSSATTGPVAATAFHAEADLSCHHLIVIVRLQETFGGRPVALWASAEHSGNVYRLRRRWLERMPMSLR